MGVVSPASRICDALQMSARARWKTTRGGRLTREIWNDPNMAKKPELKCLEGGKRHLEEALLFEFAKPGVGNLRKIAQLGERLRPKGALRAVTPPNDQENP